MFIPLLSRVKPISPLQLSPWLYLDSRLGTDDYDHGDSVTGWPDQSGNGFDADNSDLEFPVMAVTGDTSPLGQRMVQFRDGVSPNIDSIGGTATWPTPTNGWTFVFYARCDGGHDPSSLEKCQIIFNGNNGSRPALGLETYNECFPFASPSGHAAYSCEGQTTRSKFFPNISLLSGAAAGIGAHRMYAYAMTEFPATASGRAAFLYRGSDIAGLERDAVTGWGFDQTQNTGYLVSAAAGNIGYVGTIGVVAAYNRVLPAKYLLGLHLWFDKEFGYD